MGVRVREWKGAWWVYIDHQGKRTLRRMGTGATGKKAADTAALMYAAKLALGEDVHRLAKRSITLAVYSQKWLSGLQCKPTTMAKYESIMRRWWLPLLGAVPLDQLTRRQVREVLSQRAATYAKATLALMIAVLQSCLSAALAEELINDNVASRLGRLPGKPARAIVVFSSTELQHLLTTAQRVQPEAHTLLLLLARTGLRIGEALTLQAQDIDIGAGVLHVKRTWGLRQAHGEARFNSPKGGYERIVDMTPQLTNAIAALVPQSAFVNWLFTLANSEPLSPVDFHYKVWKPVIGASGLPYCKPHSLRHTYASLLLAHGVSVAYVCSQLGHASVKTTIDIYGHYIPGERVRFVDQLDHLG